MMTKFHYHYLLDYSPWPLIISLNSFNMMISFLMMFKYNNFFSILSVVPLMMSLSMFWWIFYSKEFCYQGFDSQSLESGLKNSMLLFISSEIFFFFSFFWSYFHFFLSPGTEIGINWPPEGLEMFEYMKTPLTNTLILLSSGVTITLSHSYYTAKKSFNGSIFLMLTIILGVFFSFLQYEEYSNSFFSMSDCNFGSIFFLLTGFHGAHVIIGFLFLTIVLLRSFNINNTESSFLMFEMSSWYWHFVDVVWIFLYFIIYYING